MATPRKKLVDSEHALFYHLISRCVRGSYLCGKDLRTGKNYNHRKRWIVSRIKRLARSFAIEVHAYAVMSNHFHLVVHYDPKEADRWSDSEVVERWFDVFPKRSRDGKIDHIRSAIAKAECLKNPSQIQHFRKTLGCMSMFMKHLKQPVALRANQEDGCSGHFFEQRFYSGALVSEKAVIAAMAYVDLNPVRAKIARSIEECNNTSIAERLQHLKHTKQKIRRAIEPIVSGNKVPRQLGISTGRYIDLLKHISLVTTGSAPAPIHRESLWVSAIQSLSKRQRAYGTAADIEVWRKRQGFRRKEAPLP